MSSETVYLKISQVTEVYEPEVFVRDIAKVHCQNKTVAAKVNAIKVISFKKADSTYIGSVMELLKKMEDTDANIQINSIGEQDFVINYRKRPSGMRAVQWMKTAVMCVTAFFGAAFAIMAFNNDSGVTDIFANLYYLIMKSESNGFTLLEVSYSIGLALGILVFFNHFASWKLTLDPTPIEVEMRLYEENLNKALIGNHGRKEKGIDVS